MVFVVWVGGLAYGDCGLLVRVVGFDDECVVVFVRSGGCVSDQVSEFGGVCSEYHRCLLWWGVCCFGRVVEVVFWAGTVVGMVAGDRGFLVSDSVVGVLANTGCVRLPVSGSRLQAAFRDVAGEFPVLFPGVSWGRVGAVVSCGTVESVLGAKWCGVTSDGGFWLDQGWLRLYWEDVLRGRFVAAGVGVGVLAAAGGLLVERADFWVSAGVGELLVSG